MIKIYIQFLIKKAVHPDFDDDDADAAIM